MRGKCRHCDHSLSQGGELWYSEWDADAPEVCWEAPPRTCGPCGGSGVVLLPDAYGPGRPGRLPCVPCRGHGYVPGFHWPWRQPPPPQ